MTELIQEVDGHDNVALAVAVHIPPDLGETYSPFLRRGVQLTALQILALAHHAVLISSSLFGAE